MFDLYKHFPLLAQGARLELINFAATWPASHCLGPGGLAYVEWPDEGDWTAPHPFVDRQCVAECKKRGTRIVLAHKNDREATALISFLKMSGYDEVKLARNEAELLGLWMTTRFEVAIVDQTIDSAFLELLHEATNERKGDWPAIMEMTRGEARLPFVDSLLQKPFHAGDFLMLLSTMFDWRDIAAAEAAGEAASRIAVRSA